MPDYETRLFEYGDFLDGKLAFKRGYQHYVEKWESSSHEWSMRFTRFEKTRDKTRTYGLYSSLVGTIATCNCTGVGNHSDLSLLVLGMIC
jgi:hypothetical protein